MALRRKAFEDLTTSIVEKLQANYNGEIGMLSSHEQEIVRLSRLESDMYNGGFLQFYNQWGQGDLEKTITILQKIGAQETYKLITEYRQIVHNTISKSHSKKTMILEQDFTEEQKKRMAQLDELFWDNPDDIHLIGYNNYILEKCSA